MSSAEENVSTNYHHYLPDLSQPRFTTMRTQNCYTYAESFLKNQVPPWLYALQSHWKQKLYPEPFRGVSIDGKPTPEVYPTEDEGIPIDSIVSAASHILETITEPSQKEKLTFPINAPQWRTWSNPEFLLSNYGLRLEELSEPLSTAILDLLKATFSPEGYQKAISAMRINAFLGNLVEAPSIMNELSYNFLLFGEPSATSAWGFSFYGHHLCLNVFFKNRQLFIAPTFTGAEPNLIDAGPWAGTRILHHEEELGLQLMTSLPSDVQSNAQVYKLLKDPAMSEGPEGRWNKDDQRHLCGAFRDNRIVPYEGVCVSCFSDSQKELVLDILAQFLLYYPESSRRKKLTLAKKFFDETWFCWIGNWEGEQEAFYYRIQSPVILVEFDHHSGVFLSNEEPKRFHIHTIVRFPNGGDYGSAVRTEEERLKALEEVEEGRGAGL